MLISDWIAQNGLDAAFAYLKNTPGFAILLRGMPTQHHIEPGLAKLGITTIEHLNATVQAIHANVPNHRVLAEMIRPVPSFDMTWPTKILYNSNVGQWAGQPVPPRPMDIDGLIHRLFAESQRVRKHPDFHRGHSDLEYSLLPQSAIDWIAANRPSIGYNFNGSTPTQDCDNAVALDYGWLTSLGPTDAAIGTVGAVIHHSGGAFGHAFTMVVRDDLTIWFIDNLGKDPRPRSPDSLIQFGVLVTMIEIVDVQF